MNVRFATDSRVYVQSALQETKVCLKNAFCKIAGMILQTRSGVERKKDEYSARSLKDIILCLDEPEEIKTISQPSFISKVLNQSQKQAVMKL